MRTTLVLSDAAYEVARSLAISQRRPLGEVVSELILGPEKIDNNLLKRNRLGFLTFTASEPLTAERIKELLDDE